MPERIDDKQIFAAQIKAARQSAGLTQLQAIRVLRPDSKTPKTWNTWEKDGTMSPEAWEKFLKLTKKARRRSGA